MKALDVAVGAAAVLERAVADALTDALTGARRRWERPARLLGNLPRDAPEAMRRRLAGLAETGAERRVRARREADRAVAAAIAAVARSWPVDQVIDMQLERVLRGTVDEVLALLEREPDRIRVLVRGQRDSVVGEVVDRVRTGAAAGDAYFDRFTMRRGQPGGTPPSAGAP